MSGLWFSRTDTGFRAWFQAVRSTGELRTGATQSEFTFVLVSPDDSGSMEFFVSESQQKSGFYFADITSSYILTSGSGDYGASVELAIGSPQSITDAFSNVLHVTEDDWDSLRDTTIALVEYQRSSHSADRMRFVDPVSGSDSSDGTKRSTAKKTIANALSSVTQEHTSIIVLAGATGQQVISENIVMSTPFTFLRGPGLDVQLIGASDASPTVSIQAEGCSVEGFEVTTLGTGTPDAIEVSANFAMLTRLRVFDARRHAIFCTGSNRLRMDEAIIEGAGRSGVGSGLVLSASSGALINGDSLITSGADHGILVDPGITTADDNIIDNCTLTEHSGYGVNILAGAGNNRFTGLAFSGNTLGDINNNGTKSIIHNTVLDNYRGIIHIDTTSGNTGVSYPLGTIEVPVDNYSDAKTLADLAGFREFRLANGVLTLTSSLNEWVVFGATPEAEVAFNGQNVNGTRFSGLKVSGIMSGNVSVNDGILEDVSNFLGFASFCGLSGDLTLGDGESTIDRGRSQEPGSKLPGLIFGVSSSLNMRAYSGGAKVENMTTSINSGTIEFVGGAVEIDTSCTAGELVIRGIVDVIDNNAGTNVIVEAALARSPIADVVWDEIVPGFHDTSGSAGKLLQTAGTGGVDTDLLAAAVWDVVTSSNDTPGTMGWLQNKLFVMSQSLDKVRAVTCGRWIISGSQMIHFDDDNTTEVLRHDLFTTDGSPFFSDTDAPAERVVTGSA